MGAGGGPNGILIVVFWLAYCVCTVAAGVFSFIPALFDVLAVHLSSGERTVYERYLPGLPYQVPNTWFSKRSNGIPTAEKQKVLAAAVQSYQTKQLGAAMLPPAQEGENEVISMAEKLVCLTFDDGFGSGWMFPYYSEN